MQNQINHADFDFKKIIATPIKQFEKQSYKKVLFLAIGVSVFLSLGISIKDSFHNSSVKSDAIMNKKTLLSLQEIKNMSEIDFEAMTNYIAKNSNIYDEKVHFIQSIVAKAEVENYQDSMSTSQASSLGVLLDEYKKNILDDSFNLTLIRKNVLNDIPISKEDSEIFFKYQIIYKTKSVVRFKSLEDKMQDLLYSKYKGNNNYNIKNNVYDTVKLLDQKINNTFNFIETPKPKM